MNSLCYHPALVIPDHQWRPGLPGCWAELSQNLRSAESAGRVEGVAGIFQALSSPIMSLGVFTFSYVHGMVPLLEELPIKFIIDGKIGSEIFSWWRFGPARMDGCCGCKRAVRGQTSWINIISLRLLFKVIITNMYSCNVIRHKLTI